MQRSAADGITVKPQGKAQNKPKLEAMPDSDPDLDASPAAQSGTAPATKLAQRGQKPWRVWSMRLVWGVASLAVLAVASWVLVPPILKSQLEKRVSEQLGRAFTVGKIDFRPWSLELELSDLALARADGRVPQIQIKRVFADASLQSVRRLAPVLDALQIDGLDVKLTHLGNGKYDIDDVLALLNKPPEKPADPNAAPLGFALFNVALNGASLDFVDKSVGKTHELRALNLTVPFLSNLDANREVKTEPRLAFRFNGSVFDSAAASTPFAQSQKTDATIRLANFDLKPYLVYLPASLPVRLVAGVVDLDVKLAFEQSPRAAVKLTGSAEVKEVKVQDGAVGDLLAFDALKATLEDVRPLEQHVKLSRLALTAPRLEVKRDKAGELNLMSQAAAGQEASKAKPAQLASPEAKTGATAQSKAQSKAEAKASAWQVEIGKIEVTSGVVNFSDDATQPAARLALKNLKLEADALVWPFAKPFQFSGSTQLEDIRPVKRVGGGVPVGSLGSANELADLKFDGQATDQAAQVNASLANFALGLVAPYLAQFLEPGLAGNLATELALDWNPQNLKLTVKQVTVGNLVLGGSGVALATGAGSTTGKAQKALKDAKEAKEAKDVPVKLPEGTLAMLKKLEILDSQLDLTQQTLVVGKVALSQPATSVERDANNRWMFERWLKPSLPAMAGNTGNAGNAANAERATSGKPWSVNVKDIALDGGTFKFVDKALAKPVVLEVLAVKAGLKNFALDAKKPFPLTLSFKLKQPQGEAGQLDYKGDVGLSPLSAQGSLAVTQMPVHAFEPYFAGALNIELLRAEVGFKGDVKLVSGGTGAGRGNTAPGQTIRVNGDAVLEEFRAHTLADVALPPAPITVPSGDAAAKPVESAGLAISEELLTWKALSLRGLDVTMAPGVATTVTVVETALTDFFARVQIDPTGRFNLQDLVKSSSPSVPPTAAPNPVGTAITPNSGASSAVSARLEASSEPQAVINIGPISLINGKVFFSDRFIRPNYSANLSELNGRLSAFSSVAAAAAPAATPALATGSAPTFQMADLELRGRAEGTAALEILGKLNPLAKPLALDITAKVRDLELPPLSPYSVKYAGHGIERGKLSVDLAYVVLPSGQLEAKNKIILNQLKFGDKVEGAPASLPVRLAVALLADRNGVIDLDLPVSGSLNDPQFRLGPIIFKIIVNIIVKAITAPFSLLAAAFGGGGDELSQVGFAPGSATLSADGQAGLDKVAKALLDRPALRMTVVGLSNLEEEREGYKQERLKALLEAEKRRAQVVGGSARAEIAPPGAAIPAATVVSEAETPVLLKEIFRRSDFPKPRNVAGIVKDLPTEEMQALLLANIVVTEDAMRELALQRGVAVKDYLASKQLPVERLFLGNAKSEGDAKAAVAVQPSAAAGPQPGASASEGAGTSAVTAKWKPRAELNLATN